MFLFKRKNQVDVVSEESYVLGTTIQITAYGEGALKGVAKSIQRLNDIDDKMSVFKEDSEVYKINKNAGGNYQSLSLDTYKVIENAIQHSFISKGSFDITIKPLVDL